MGITLWIFETYGKIVVRLIVIKYKMDIACYLTFLSLGLAIELSHQAH